MLNAPNVVNLTETLINTASISGAEGPMSDWLKAWLEPRGWRVQLQQVAPQRYNVLALRPNVDQPRLLFNTHIDTVPPFIPASRDEQYIYGRGACDTKGLLAAQLLAADQLLADGQNHFGLLYVVGEEVDHCGMIRANDLNLQPDYMIVGEPTESKLAIRQKGILKLKLECHGKAAHSGYPHTGVSAIDILVDLLKDLRSQSWPTESELGQTTLNVGLIQGGRAANVVADYAMAEIMFRVVTRHQQIHEMVRERIGQRAQLTVISANDPVNLTAFEGFDTSIVSFNTDIPYFRFNGKALLYGAGSILDAHTAHEKIAVADLQQLVGDYVLLAKKCLSV